LALGSSLDCGNEEREKGMSKKLFVGSLSWNVDDESLREAFARFGEVTEAKIILHRDSGRSRGFGFVTYSDNQAAAKAISEMNGTELDGRTIKVDEVQDRESQKRGGILGRRR